jgi:hypothetical protein
LRELFNLTEKYGFTAPLVCINSDFDFTTFTRLCNSLNVSTTTTAMASNIFIALQPIEEKIGSLDYVGKKIDKKITVIRHHLNLLEKRGLVQSEFITTDPIRKRRGKLFQLVVPSGKTLSSQTLSKDGEVDKFQLVASDTVSNISVYQYDNNARFLELKIVRYLVKAMRTNRKDTSSKISIEVKNRPNEKPIKITARAEGGRLMYLPDLSYYAGTITWLVSHIKTILKTDEPIGETYTLPLEPIIALSKNVNMDEASGGGYITNAIASLHRISGTTFDMTNLASHVSASSIKELELFYKMFRLEAIVTFNDERGTEKKAAVIQFPQSTIHNIVKAIKENSIVKELLLFDSDLFSTNNEVEILFSLWAREQVVTGSYKQRLFTWNELRESVAPTASLVEFKRKFSNVMIANADPDYKAVIHERVSSKITDKIGTTHLSGKSSGEKVVEYGRSTIQGFLINIGYSQQHGCPIISFRRDMSGMIIKSSIGSNL